MKKDHVKIGGTYTAKVSGGIVPVRITEEVWQGEKHIGWKGTNTQTGRAVRVKSAQRLRAAVGGGKAAKATAATKAAPAGDVGPGGAGGAGADKGAPAAKSAGTRAHGPATAKAGGKGKGKRRQVRPTKGTRPAKARKPREGGKLSGLDAAAKVLADSGKPMRVGEVVEAMTKKGLWTSPNGKTPEATVYAAIIREIRDKGVESRFAKKDRGLFAAAGR
ncbi:MAG: winged helix-turn-helix domain-containing protein [Phycisphaerales bacterium]